MKAINDFKTMGQLINAYLSGEKIQGMDFDNVNVIEVTKGLIYPIALDRICRSSKRLVRGGVYVPYKSYKFAKKSKFVAQNGSNFVYINAERMRSII